ncbi:hypothetical protein L1887_20358 [Cichorium endivia]|nr:hypothetical protein L1887_20358 [Cichorium endivia]
MDVLVSVACDEDLAAIVEEYDRASPDAKIRAVLCPVRSLKTISPVPSFESLVDFSASKPPPHPVVGNSVVRKGTQHFQAIDFSTYKLPRYPLAVIIPLELFIHASVLTDFFCFEIEVASYESPSELAIGILA